MCGRYTLRTPLNVLLAQFAAERQMQLDFRPRQRVACVQPAVPWRQERLIAIHQINPCQTGRVLKNGPMDLATLKSEYHELQTSVAKLHRLVKEAEDKIDSALESPEGHAAALAEFRAVESALAQVREFVSNVRAAIAKVELPDEE
jgi:hypothetical protein